MGNLLYEKFQKLNLFKESEQIENGYNLFLEQVLKKTVNNGYNDILVDYESSDYNIFIEFYKILSSLYGIFYLIYFIIKVIFI